MKLFKNIVRLLVLASFSLALSPLTTAEAADDPITDSSEVTVNVLSGILTLDEVPDFNFGTMMLGTTAKLKNNTVDTTGYTTSGDSPTAGVDGKSTGILQVTDSRNLTSKENIPGFTISAAISQFRTIDSDSSDPVDGTLYLNSMPLVNQDNENVSSTSQDLLTSSVAINSGSSAKLIDLDKGSYNPGIIKTAFDTPDSASLKLDGTNSGTTKSAKKMNAVITWTVTAKPTVTTN